MNNLGLAELADETSFCVVVSSVKSLLAELRCGVKSFLAVDFPQLARMMKVNKKFFMAS